MLLLLPWLSACTPEPVCTPDLQVYEDLDGDGFGTVPLDKVCEATEGQALVSLDCDDDDPDVNPDARDVCNGVDDDCDGTADGGTTQKLWYRDRDGDGYGARYPAELTCERPGDGWVDNDEDCDDDSDRIHPGGREICAGGDEDCDGLAGDLDDSVDPETFDTFWRDADGDGYGSVATTAHACDAPPGFVPNHEDCDDRDPTFARNTYFADADGDGFGDPNNRISACTLPAGAAFNDDDCDDGDDTVTNEHEWYEDDDGDGYGAGVSLGFGCTAPFPDLVGAGGDCAPDDPLENPDTPEDCTDGFDQNCNGLVDCADADCGSDPSCVPPCADGVLVGPLPLTTSGTTTGTGNDQSGSCGGGSAPELVFQWVPAVSGNVTIDTIGSGYDTVLYAKSSCLGVTLACNDDTVGLQSRINVSVTAGDPILIFVDGYSSTSHGPFTLNLQ